MICDDVVVAALGQKCVSIKESISLTHLLRLWLSMVQKVLFSCTIYSVLNFTANVVNNVAKADCNLAK